MNVFLFIVLPLMSRNACNGGNGETGEKSPAAGDLNWMPKVAPWRLAILACISRHISQSEVALRQSLKRRVTYRIDAGLHNPW